MLNEVDQCGFRGARWAPVFLVVAMASTVMGNVSFDKVTWGNGGDTLGWASQGGVAASVTAPAEGENGYLSMNFNPTDPMPMVQSDRLATSGGGYTGSYAGVSGATFDFRGQAGAPQWIFFEGGASTWEQLLTGAAPSWQPYSVSFVTDSGWSRVGSSSESFAQALADVKLIGFETTFIDSGSPFAYGVDNWQFTPSSFADAVPEPDSVLMMVALLLSLGVMFGKPFLRRFPCFHPAPKQL